MTQRSKVLTIWLVMGVLALLITLPLARPLAVGWQCYWLYENGHRQQADVLHKLDNATFALQIVEGPDAGEACTANTSWAIFEATELGDRVEVVRLESKLGECELTSTIEASEQLLWIISGGLLFAWLGTLALGWALTRNFSQPGVPARRIAADPADVLCPACGKAMDEGYLAAASGIHWRNVGEPIGMPHALGGLPGTVGWRGRPRLHGFRCASCEVVTFQYGLVRKG